jgi:tetratricopeptide (TPR) repeat protein
MYCELEALMWRGITLLALFIFALPTPSSAADDWAICTLGDAGEAIIAACTRVLQSGKLDHGQSAIAYRQRGSAYGTKGELDRAIADFTEAIRLDPRNAEGFARRADAYLDRQQLDQAIGDFSEAIRLGPDSPTARNNRGVAYWRKRDYARAIEDFDQAIRLNSTNPRAFLNRALVYEDQQQFDRAMADIAEAIHLNPNMADAFWLRGRLNEGQKNYRAAIEDYTRAIKLDPNNSIFFNDRGGAELDQTAAIDEMMRSLPDAARRQMAGNVLFAADESNPDGGASYQIDACSGKAHLLGRGGEQRDNYELAIEDFSQAIKLDRQYVFAFTNRARAYANICEYDRAIQDYDEAVRLDPRNARWLYQRGEVKIAKGNKTGGRSDIAAARAIDPNVDKRQ